ncbi:MAG: 4-hydroxybenzoate decarboxylase [Gemmatimonadetes bacterium]|nr:4-hydroxybenzoate decarboxylase [Gemmatimonadota bacterium]
MPDLPPGDLRSFLNLLAREGELCVVETPVDPYLEIAEIHRRVIAAGGPTLAFVKPKRSDLTVVTNLFGTKRRIELAFGNRPACFVRDAARMVREAIPPTLESLAPFRGMVRDALNIGVRRGLRGPVTETIERPPRLGRLPFLTSWIGDGGPFATLPLVYTEHPEGGDHNLGIYRIQRFDDETVGVHWQIAKGGGYHHAAAEERGMSLPLVVNLGGPPALTLAAVAPLPENVGELLLASLVLGSKVALSESPAGPLPLLADAEIALIGRAPAGERRIEGPFGDHYGYYSLAHPFPYARIDALCRREDAIFPATVVGKPRQEDFYLGDHLQELLSPLFPLVMPGVIDLWSYGETGYHSLSAAVVRERYRREAMVSAFRILGEGQLSLTKFLLITDKQQDLKDFRSLLEHILERVRWETDLFVFPNLSLDTLDYSGPRLNEGSKGVLLGLGDAIRRLPEELVATLPAGARDARLFCRGCLVIDGPSKKDEPDYARRAARHPDFEDWPLIVVADRAGQAAASVTNFLWTTFTRFDPASDIVAAEERVVENAIVRSGPIAIDARLKPDFPDELFCDGDTARMVTARWKEYFPGGMEMGSSDWADLEPSR